MKKLITLLMLLVCISAGAARRTTKKATGNPKPFTVPTLQDWTGGSGKIRKASLVRVLYREAELAPVAEYMSKCIGVAVTPIPETEKKLKLGQGDIMLSVAELKQATRESYLLKIDNTIHIQGQTAQAVLWGAQTVMQILDQTGELPFGTAIDSPDYPMRGFMIDCGRKYIPMDYLRSLVKVMSYYKMNTLQVHLNDNGFKKYFHNNWDETYSAFRLESEYFPGLTARDGYYTKDEFRQFCKESALLGVEIIPEIDAPAHALAFTHYRPSLACEEFGVDHLDLTNPQVVPFLDSLWTEYIGGPDPVFAGPRVHIGTDEYSNKKQEVVELFRSLADHLIALAEKNGKQAVLWGSLTHAKGETPVKAGNVMMSMWYNGYADPVAMKQLGYQMISIPDGYMYIVPEAGYYYNYLNDRYLYEHWTPAQIGNQKFEEKDPQISGGMFAVWNDVCGNGISVGDIHHRVYPAMQVLSQKCWLAVNDTIGYQQWDDQRKKLFDGPLTDELGRSEMEYPNLLPGKKITNRDEAQLGYDYQVDFDITWKKEDRGAMLTYSNRAEFYLCDPISNMLGFSRDGYLFTFNYSGREGVTEHITIRGTNKSTTLLVNGRKIQELGYDERLAADQKPYNVIRTLVFPLTHTGNYKSLISNFSAKKL